MGHAVNWVELVLKNKKAGFESKAAAERAFDAVVNAIRVGVERDGNVQVNRFGTFSPHKARAGQGRETLNLTIQPGPITRKQG